MIGMTEIVKCTSRPRPCAMHTYEVKRITPAVRMVVTVLAHNGREALETAHHIFDGNIGNRAQRLDQVAA